MAEQAQTGERVVWTAEQVSQAGIGPGHPNHPDHSRYYTADGALRAYAREIGGQAADGGDFDVLLDESSFGSAQALAIRAQTPATARARVRQVLGGGEFGASAQEGTEEGSQ